MCSKIFSHLTSVWGANQYGAYCHIIEFIQKILNHIYKGDIHAIKGWSLDDETYYLRFHIRVPGETKIIDIDTLKLKIKSILTQHKVQYSTIEFESTEHQCDK